MARPTKYEEGFPAKVYEYLEKCSDKEYEFHATRGEKSDTFQEKVRTELPTMAGLAIFLQVNKSTLYEWKKNHPKFSDSLDELIAQQEERLIQGTLSGRYNATIGKLILASNHNYVERKDVTTDGKELPRPIMKVEKNNPDVG